LSRLTSILIKPLKRDFEISIKVTITTDLKQIIKNVIQWITHRVV